MFVFLSEQEQVIPIPLLAVSTSVDARCQNLLQPEPTLPEQGLRDLGHHVAPRKGALDWSASKSRKHREAVMVSLRFQFRSREVGQSDEATGRCGWVSREMDRGVRIVAADTVCASTLCRKRPLAILRPKQQSTVKSLDSASEEGDGGLELERHPRLDSRVWVRPPGLLRVCRFSPLDDCGTPAPKPQEMPHQPAGHDPAPATPPNNGGRRFRNLSPPILFALFLLLGLRFLLADSNPSVDLIHPTVTVTTTVHAPHETSSPEHLHSAVMSSEQT